MTVHKFDDSLARSHRYADAPWWGEVYRKAFPTMVTCADLRKDGWHQRAGIDRVLTLEDSTVVKIDEKVREETWPDILLEIWSRDWNGVPGWARKDLACDYIAYAMAPSRTCYLLPFQMLRRAVDQNYKAWDANARSKQFGFSWRKADNPGYVTWSIAVPTATLLNAIRDTMVIRWSDDTAHPQIGAA